MKKGTMMLIIISIGYLITLSYILAYGVTQDKEYAGADALYVLDDYIVGKQVQVYVDQSARNAMYSAAQDTHKNTFVAKDCPSVGNALVLFSEDSCELTEELLEKNYLHYFKQHFGELLKNRVDGVTFVNGAENYVYELTTRETTVELVGIAKETLHYKGEKVAYDFNPSFRESIFYDFHAALGIKEDLSTNLACIVEHTEDFLTTCSFSEDYTWSSSQEEDSLVLIATQKTPKSSINNIVISFAINLKTIQETQNNLFD